MTIWFISDTHFSHESMLKFTNETGGLVRPEFSSIEDMDETMVERWNAVVRPSDHIYHLGDVAMRRPHLQIVKRLNGHKRLIFGNHDIFDYKSYAEVGFKKLMSYRVFGNLIFSHIPIHPLSVGRFAGNVHGHIHERDEFGPQYLNISVERIAYQPVSLEEVRSRFAAREALKICP